VVFSTRKPPLVLASGRLRPSTVAPTVELMTSQAIQYPRSALTEATIEFRLREELSLKDLEKVRHRFGKFKWKEEKIELLEFQLTAGGQSHMKRSLVSYKLTSPDGREVVQLHRTGLGYSVMAPYPGWDQFVGRLFDLSAEWRKDVGGKKIGRVGVRYINRFDIPCVPGSTIQIPEYMAFTMTEPEILDLPVKVYSIQLNSGIVTDGLSVNLVSEVVPSPLIDHFSITLDIDIGREGVDLPQSDDDIRVLLTLMRQRRTEIFERCIKDPLRKLIS
jgi:uncharacterized protein (TIGR04255 family)